MSLTESGETLFERAKGILDEVAEVELIASASTIKPRGLRAPEFRHSASGTTVAAIPATLS